MTKRAQLSLNIGFSKQNETRVSKLVEWKNSFLFGLILAFSLQGAWALSPEPLEFSNVGADSASQQQIWDELLKYKLFGKNSLAFTGQDIDISEVAGHTGTMGDFTMNETRHTVNGHVVVGGDLTMGNGTDVFDSGYVRVGGSINVSFNARTSTTFNEHVCSSDRTTGSEGIYGSYLNGWTDSDLTSCPIGFPELETNLIIPTLDPSQSYGAETWYANGGTLVQDGRPAAGELVKDIYLDAITLDNAAQLLILQDSSTYGLTRIFVENMYLSSTGWNIGITHDGSTMIPLDEYGGTLLIYSPNTVSVAAGNRTMMGSYITAGDFNVQQGLSFAGQILANNLSVNAGFNAVNFNYVPFDPPSVDPETFASGIVTEWGGSQNLSIQLDKKAIVDVKAKYFFADSTGSIIDDFQPDLPDSNSFRTIEIPLGQRTPTTPVSVLPFNDIIDEGNEVVYIVIYDIEGAILPNGAKSYKFPFSIADDDFNQPPVIRDTTIVLDENPGDATLLIDLDVISSDVDGDSLGWTILSQTPNNAANLQVGDSSRLITNLETLYSFEANPFLYIDVEVIEPLGKTDTARITIQLVDLPEVPVFSVVPDTTINEGTALNWDLIQFVTDDDNSESFSFVDLSNTGFAIVDSAIVWTPEDADVGSHLVQLEVTDKDGLKDTVSFVINVLNVNDVPEIQNPLADLVDDEDFTGTLTVDLSTVFTDDDGDVLTLTVSGNTHTSMTIVGTDLQITANTDRFGVENVTITATDPSGASVSDVFVVTINSINDAPNATDDSYSVNEGELLSVSATEGVINKAVADSDDHWGETFTATVEPLENVQKGTLTLTTTGAFVYQHDGSETLTDFFTYELSDGEGGKDTATVTITINAVNDTPLVGDVIAPKITLEDSNFVWVIPEASFVDPEAEALVWSATIPVSWQDWLSFDANTQTFTGVPRNEDVATETIVITVEDPAGAKVSQSVLLEVRNTNDAPVFSVDYNADVQENTGVGTVVLTVEATDVDVGDAITYEISGSVNYEINSTTGEVSVVNSPDFETVQAETLTVIVSDIAGAADTTQVIFDITNVIERPAVSVGPYFVDENSPAGTVVDTVDFDNATAFPTATFELVAGEGTGDGIFTIDSITGEISVLVGADLDFESQKDYTLVVSARNADGTAPNKTIIITLNDVNEEPSIEDQTLSIDENLPAGATLGAVISQDPEGNQLYQLLDDLNGMIAIDANTGEVVAKGPFNFEEEDSYTVQVVVNDGEFKDTASVTIAINDVNDAPVIGEATPEVSEDTKPGSTVVIISATDEDLGDVLEYRLTNDAGGKFVISSTTGEIKLVESLDFETEPTITIEVEVSDGKTTVLKEFTVTVLDANDSPIVKDTALVVVENTNPGTVVGVVPVIDPDGDALEYIIVDGADDYIIDPETGEIKVAPGANIDFESKQVDQVVIRLTDGKSDTVEVVVEVSLLNVVEVSKVTPQKVTDAKRTHDGVEVVFSNQDSVTVVWEEDGELIFVTYPVSQGENVIERIFQNPAKDLPDTARITVNVNKVPPTAEAKIQDLGVDEDGVIYVNNKDYPFVWETAQRGENPDQTIPGDTTIVGDLIEDKVVEIVIELEDVYGNIVYDTIKVVLDTKPPVVEIITPTEGEFIGTLYTDVEWKADGVVMDTLTKEYFEVGEQQVIREFTDLAGNYGADTVNVIVELENNAISVIVENSLVKDFELNIEEYYETKGRETPTKENFNIGFINHETGLLEEVAFQDGTKSTLIEETERRGYDPETPKPGIGLVLDLQFPLNGGAAIDAEGNPLDENYVGLCEDGLPMWHLKVDNILVNVYDNIGQYVTSVVVPEIEIDSPKYLDAEGKAKVYLELSRVSSKFRSVTGRVWGSGVYPITIKARTSAEPINCDLEKRKATISNYSDLKKIGYKRNEQ